MSNSKANWQRSRPSTRGKRKPLVLTIKQYQAFAGQLSDLHRTMVVAAMCSGMRVSEVLALRWDQLDLANGLLSIQPRVANGGMVTAEGPEGPLPMDPVLLESLLEWRKKTSAAGWYFRRTSRAAATMPDQSSRTTSDQRRGNSAWWEFVGTRFPIPTGVGWTKMERLGECNRSSCVTRPRQPSCIIMATPHRNPKQRLTVRSSGRFQLFGMTLPPTLRSPRLQGASYSLHH